jgi:hypothetical protein
MTTSVAITPKESAQAACADALQGRAATRPTRRDRTRSFLLLVGSVFLGVAVGGIPLSLYDLNGYGQVIMFSSFVAYLVLNDLRARL